MPMFTPQKAFLMMLSHHQHFYQIIYRITAENDDRITTTGDVRITADSDY